MKRLFAVFIGLALVASSAHSADYEFTKVADTVSGSFTQLFIPAIGNDGSVVFRAIDQLSVDGVYSTPPTAVIADQSDARFASLSDPSISNNGLVAFDAFEEGGLDNGIYRSAVGENGPATLLYDTSDDFSCVLNPSINSSGVVAFRGESAVDCDSFDIVTAGIYVGTGGAPTLIADNSLGNSNDFSNVGFEPRINNNGTVVFTAEFLSGDFGVFTGNGGVLTTIVEGGGTLSSFLWPSINCAGTVAVVAFLGSGGGFSILQGDGSEPATTVIDTSSGLRDFRLPSINCSETIAFIARADNFGPDGLYTVSGGVIRKVIEVGGSLEGLTVEQITFSNTGLNDNNQLVFRAKLSDDNEYIFVADEIDTNAALFKVILDLIMDNDP
jgi:hypothetical protein